MSATSTEPVSTRQRPPAGRGPAVAAAVFGAVVVLVAAVSLVGLAISTVERSSRTFSGVREVQLDTGSGDVELVAADRSDVRVQITTHSSWARPRLRQVVEAGVLELSGRCRFVIGDCSVAFRIEAPSSTPVRLHTGSGNLDISGLRASAEARTGSGDITVGDVTGAVSAETGSGNITLDRVQGEVRTETGSGDIDARQVTARTVEAHTSSGNVDLVAVSTPPERVAVSTASGDVTLTVPDGVYRLSADADSGDVDTGSMRQDPSSPRQIEVRTGSGNIVVRTA